MPARGSWIAGHRTSVIFVKNSVKSNAVPRWSASKPARSGPALAGSWFMSINPSALIERDHEGRLRLELTSYRLLVVVAWDLSGFRVSPVTI